MRFIRTVSEEADTGESLSITSHLDTLKDPIQLTNGVLNAKGQNRQKKYKFLRLSEIDGACPREWSIGHVTDAIKWDRVAFASVIAMDMGSALHHWVQNSGVYFENIIGYWRCYDDQTEVLTERGFKFFKDVSYFDKIATLNPQTNCLEYHFPIAKQILYHKGDMLDFSSSRLISLCVTEDHSMWVRKNPRSDTTSFELCDASDLEDVYGFQFQKDADWIGVDCDFILPEVSHKHHKGRSKTIALKDYLEFMAAYLSDGSCGLYDGGYRVTFSKQVGTKGREIIELFLSRIGINYHSTDRNISFYSKQWVLYLEQFGVSLDKFIPPNIKSLSKDSLRYFLNLYLEWDGTVDDKGRATLYTSSDRLRDDLQEIILKAGWASSYFVDNRELSTSNGLEIHSNNPRYHININKTKLRPNCGDRYGSPIKRVQYEGFVYDLTVPNHIMYIRRNGKCVWSGNCYACGNQRRFGVRPKEPCEFCGASPRATHYSEYMFRLQHPFRVVGKMDLIIKVGDVYRIVEIKTTGKEIDRPMGEHVAQLASYMYFSQFDEGGLPIKIDRSVGYLVYFNKMFNYRAPVKTFPVKPTQRFMAPLIEKATQFTEGVNLGILPPVLNACLASRWNSGPAKGCPVSDACQKYHRVGAIKMEGF